MKKITVILALMVTTAILSRANTQTQLATWYHTDACGFIDGYGDSTSGHPVAHPPCDKAGDGQCHGRGCSE